MRVRSEIKEINKVMYDTIVEYNPTDRENKVFDENFQFNQNNISIQCKSIYTKGLHIAESTFHSAIPLANKWMTEKPHIRFFFYLKGHSYVRNGAGNQNYTHHVGMLQRNFLDTLGGGGTVVINEDDTVHHVIIKMTLDFYIDLLQSEDWIATDAFHQYILSQKPENRPNETLFMDLRIFNIIQEILNNSYIVHHRYHFLRMKLRELLFAIHQQTNYHSKIIAQTSNIDDDIEKVKAYLSLHLDVPPSSTQLAKTFIMNEKKLKQDFKKTYGMTIYAFVVSMRMEKAKKLLLEAHNVNELAILLGYQSVSHFIKVFKAHHGYTPKEFVKHFIVSS